MTRDFKRLYREFIIHGLTLHYDKKFRASINNGGERYDLNTEWEWYYLIESYWAKYDNIR